MNKYSIIIPSYNDAENLDKCLSSIRSLDFPREDFEIIVVDNNSTDNTIELVKKYPEIIYLKEQQQGASFARNKGIKQAKGDIIIFLDSDTVVANGWLKNLVEPFKTENIGAVGGAILPFNENNPISRYLGISLFLRYHRYGGQRDVKGYPSCNLAVRKEIVSKGFDTDFFNTYGEDKDICYQILDRGFRIVFQHYAIVYHKHPTSLYEFFKLLVKSSKGRFDFSKKYPYSPDIIFLNLHTPLIYAITVIISFFFKNLVLFSFLIIVPLLYFISCAVISYRESKDFILSFFIKPVFDIISVYTIYISYNYFKLINK